MLPLLRSRKYTWISLKNFEYLLCLVLWSLVFVRMMNPQSFLYIVNPRYLMTRHQFSNPVEETVDILEDENPYAVVSVCNPSQVYNKVYIQTSFDNKQKYCDRHDDISCYLSTKQHDPKTSVKWSKLAFLLEVMQNKNIKTILYLDCTTLIINNEFHMNNFKTPKTLHAFEDPLGLNLGSFVIVNNKKGRELMKEMYTMRATIDLTGACRNINPYNFKSQYALEVMMEVA